MNVCPQTKSKKWAHVSENLGEHAACIISVVIRLGKQLISQGRGTLWELYSCVCDVAILGQWTHFCTWWISLALLTSIFSGPATTSTKLSLVRAAGLGYLRGWSWACSFVHGLLDGGKPLLGGIGHSVLMLGTQDIGTHGKVLPQWGLLLSHQGWLIFIDNLSGFRLTCIWLGRHFPTDLNEEGKIHPKCEWLYHGSWRPRLNRREERKTRGTWTFLVLVCLGINEYLYPSATAVGIADSSAVTDSTLKHEPKPVCPEVVSYCVFGKKQWQKPLILSIIMCPYSKGPIGISVSSE